MEQLSKDIADLQNLVDVYHPTSFDDDVEREERYNVLTSKYNKLFSTLSHCVDRAMHKLLLAHEELNDEDAEKVAMHKDAVTVEDMYGALDRKYQIFFCSKSYLALTNFHLVLFFASRKTSSHRDFA